jgi:ppGpp synthetase/RelA/SpoT-type nucleotidyltranferase
LATARLGSKEYNAAVEVVNAWRVCHAYPINTFNATLRLKTKGYKNAVVAQRLKRLPTIIYKLQRFSMRLSQMQDIGGVRAILDSIEDVRKLQSQYEEKGRFSHEIRNVKDYINEPKPDGYRGVHIVFAYNNTLDRTGNARQYKGLLVELQIRTKWQHQWATAVETVDVMLQDKLKLGAGNAAWGELFQYVSSAFAIAENAPVLKTHEHYKTKQIFDRISYLSKRLNAVALIEGWSSAARTLQENYKTTRAYYLVIEQDLSAGIGRVKIFGYPKRQLNNAAEFYATLEKRYSNSTERNVVMVSMGDIRQLKTAYPNYFLDMNDFLEKLKAIIKTTKEQTGV